MIHERNAIAFVVAPCPLWVSLLAEGTVCQRTRLRHFESLEGRPRGVILEGRPRVCVCVFFYYTPFSSVARGVPYLLHGNYDPSTQLTLGAKATNNQKSRWRHPEGKRKWNKGKGRVGKRVTTYGGWGMAGATQPKKGKRPSPNHVCTWSQSLLWHQPPT